MLNEFIEMLLGCFDEFIPSEYIHAMFFRSVLTVGGIFLAVIGSLCFGLVIARAVFNAFNKRM